MEKQMDPYKLADLIFLELRGDLDEEGRSLLDAWKNASADNLKRYHEIIDDAGIKNKIHRYAETDTVAAWDRLNRRLTEKRTLPKRTIRRIVIYASAASILAIAGITILLTLIITPEPDREPGPIRKSKPKRQIVLTDSSTSKQKAILTTSNQEQIPLGTLKEQRIINLATTSATDINSTLTYRNPGTVTSPADRIPAMNTLETPRGGEYSIILSDGTKVYLNAATKLTFPEIFAGDIRKVLLEGEAYFEVAGSADKPFIVQTPEYSVEVLGTSFNVSAYATDKKSHTTLVEGKVEVNLQNGAVATLTPGEQASFSKPENRLEIRKVDTELYTSWKEGKFIFENECLEDIMRKLERWYDINVRFRSEELKQYHFTGMLDRYDKIADILQLIALTTDIQFSIGEQQIIVSRKKQEDIKEN